MTHAAAVGTGWWQVDLGGLYTLNKIVMFNRGESTTVANRLVGARVQILNDYGSTIANYVLGSGLIQVLDATLTYAPTPTPTGTRTQTATASNTATNSASPSQTASSTATLSSGGTSSVTASASITAASTATPTRTSDSVFPSSVRVDHTLRSSNCFHLAELLAITPSFRIVSASVAGGVGVLSSVYSLAFLSAPG